MAGLKPIDTYGMRLPLVDQSRLRRTKPEGSEATNPKGLIDVNIVSIIINDLQYL